METAIKYLSETFNGKNTIIDTIMIDWINHSSDNFLSSKFNFNIFYYLVGRYN